MLDTERLRQLNHLQDKISLCRFNLKHALQVEDKIVWSRLLKRYRMQKAQLFK